MNLVEYVILKGIAKGRFKLEKDWISVVYSVYLTENRERIGEGYDFCESPKSIIVYGVEVPLKKIHKLNLVLKVIKQKEVNEKALKTLMYGATSDSFLNK